MAKKIKKVMIIGLDGASFTVLRPWMDEGLLPNLKRLADDGVTGELQSTIPPVTGPAWTTFMTGKLPGKHGVYDFVRPDPGGEGMKIVSYDTIASETVFSLLTRHDKKICAVNLPLTYPVPDVNGYMISGMLTPKSVDDFMKPESLAAELRDKGINYVQDVWWQRYDESEIEDFLKNLIRCTEERIKTNRYLCGRCNWDFFVTVFIGTDRIQHCLWEYIFPDQDATAKKKRVTELIKKYYMMVDGFIGEMFDGLEADTSLLIMSDHGFGPLTGKVFINTLLSELGYLKFDLEALANLKRRGKGRSGIKKVIKSVDVFKLWGKIGPAVMKKVKRMSAYDFLKCIDWSKTAAYAASNTEQGIYINLKGRNPGGIVEPEEYDARRDEVIKVLKGIVHPETGEKMVSHVFKREEVYEGSCVDSAPDIIFFLKNGEYLSDVQPSESVFEPRSWRTGSGTHRTEGILLAYGRDIRSGESIEGAGIADILPTILYLLDIPIPDDLDGKVLTGIFKDDFSKKKKAVYEKALDERKGQAVSYSEEEEAELEERLKGLGYL
ncbi:MAG: alkaline phosphatase family protein [Thermodesulfobacteriota bacterium]